MEVQRSQEDPQDASPINRVNPMNTNIEAQFEYLEAGYECHETRLNEHNARLKEHEARLVNQDRILEKSNVILESLMITHCEHIGWSWPTHGIAAASYSRWHRDDVAVDRLEAENIDQFCKVRKLLRLRESMELRGQWTDPSNEAPGQGKCRGDPQGLLSLKVKEVERKERMMKKTTMNVPTHETRGPWHRRRKRKKDHTDGVDIENCHYDIHPGTINRERRGGANI